MNTNEEITMLDHSDADSEKSIEAFGPNAVDRQLREAIQLCWMLMPSNRKSIDEVEKEIHRMVERAFGEMRDDLDRFRR
jgi:hypothetical protein